MRSTAGSAVSLLMSYYLRTLKVSFRDQSLRRTARIALDVARSQEQQRLDGLGFLATRPAL